MFLNSLVCLLWDSVMATLAVCKGSGAGVILRGSAKHLVLSHPSHGWRCQISGHRLSWWEAWSIRDVDKGAKIHGDILSCDSIM